MEYEPDTEYQENRDYGGLTIYDEMAAMDDEDVEETMFLVEETRMKRLSTEYKKIGGVRDD